MEVVEVLSNILCSLYKNTHQQSEKWYDNIMSDFSNKIQCTFFGGTAPLLNYWGGSGPLAPRLYRLYSSSHHPIPSVSCSSIIEVLGKREVVQRETVFQHLFQLLHGTTILLWVYRPLRPPPIHVPRYGEEDVLRILVALPVCLQKEIICETGS